MKLSELPVFFLERKLTIEEAEAKSGQFVADLEATVHEAGIYCDADTQEPFLAYFPMKAEAALLRKAVLGVKYSKQPRSNGMNNLSRTFGMAPRKVFRKRESCRPTTLAYEQPEEHAILVGFADKFSAMMKEMFSVQYDKDHAKIAEISDEWRMTDDALWTSGVVNKSSELPYHYDRFNFETWSAMPVIRKQMRGGYLHFPEYEAVVACRDGWVLFFPGYRYLHGVTPMHPLSKEAYRYSVVYYALKGMKDCFTYAVEQSSATVKRTEREERMVQALKGEIEIPVQGTGKSKH
jgi:hypothetical protein